jgi:DNA-binding transcriptional LysR family regulator
VAVAEELHFGRAALRLRMAQPPLSQQIRKLEAEIGVPLFQRTRRHVELTAAGRTLLGEAKAILLHAEQAALAAQRARGGPVERLAVGFVPWADFSRLPLVIRAFGMDHPSVHLQVLELNTLDQISALREDRIQVGFLRPPVRDRNLAFEPVLVEHLVVAFPEGHRLRVWTRVPARLLTNELHILLSGQRAPMYRDLVMAFCRGAGFTIRVSHEADHPQIVLSLVAAGLGISLVPESAVSNPRPGLQHRSLDPPGPPIELVLAWRRGRQTPVLKSFIDVVREQRQAGSDA